MRRARARWVRADQTATARRSKSRMRIGISIFLILAGAAVYYATDLRMGGASVDIGSRLSRPLGARRQQFVERPAAENRLRPLGDDV